MNKPKILNTFLKLFEKYKNFILYGLIGVTGVTIDYLIFNLLTTQLSMNIFLANIISVTAGIINNFILNTLFNFKKKDKILLRFLSFFTVGLLGLGLSSLILKIFVDILEFNVLFVKVLSIIIVVIVQYVLNKNISFSNFKFRVKK
jgi:putative flippase GtrA